MKPGKVTYLSTVKSDPSGMSDLELINSCGRGDRAALGELFRRYHLDVYRFIARLQRSDESELDDLVQNTFMEIQKSSSRFEGRSSCKTWMFSIAANVARKNARSESRRKKRADIFSGLQVAEVSATLDRVEFRQQLVEMQNALNELPQKLRVVFVMCALEGVSGVEAARILKLRQGTLWRRLHDARKALTEALERRHG